MAACHDIVATVVDVVRGGSGRRWLATVAICMALLAGACSAPGSGSGSGGAAIPRDEIGAEIGEIGEIGEFDPQPTPGDGPTSSEDPPQSSELSDNPAGLDGKGGLLAVTGATGLQIVRPGGEVVASFASDSVVFQPTWSRDAAKLVASFIDPSTTAAEVGILDVASLELVTSAAYRPYFFYTWSYDGSRLAALGPGPNGTSVDILDSAGSPAADSPIDGSSMYVAWEPGGDALALHGGNRLLLFDDPDRVADFVDLGTVGRAFQAASWIPGTRDLLYVDSSGSADSNFGDGMNRLVRRNVDSSEVTDLGPVAGLAFISVHPDGQLAAVSSTGSNRADGDDPATNRVLIAQPNYTPANYTPAGSEPTDFAQPDPPPAAVEIVNLKTGARTGVVERVGFWLEWSPNGELLLFATRSSDQTVTWNIWDGIGSTELTGFTPTETFLRRYLPFSDQYTETPRLWSPDGVAFAFSQVVEDRSVASLLRVDDPAPRTIGSGEVVFWSPATVEAARG